MLEKRVKLRDDLNAMTPRLRRYARALTTGHSAPSELADDIVHATLMRALGARHPGDADDLVIRLYATVTQLNRETAVVTKPALAASAGRPVLVADHIHLPMAAKQTKLSAGLLSLSLEERETLLLVALEGFDHTAAARILRISRSVLVGRLAQARKALDAHLGSRPATAKGGRSVPYLRLVT